MDELIQRLVQNVGVNEETAQKAVQIILTFLTKQGPEDKVQVLVDSLGSAGLGGAAGDDGEGGLGDLFGGGVMGAVNELQGLGLGMGEIQGVTKETVDFAREKAGTDVVNAIVDGIPGLSQFV